MALEDENIEQPIQELEKRIEDLTGIPGGEDRTPEIERLRRQLQDLRGEVYSHLSAWQKTQVARHPKRPYTLDYVQMLFTNLVEIRGDRKFADDPASVGGFATYQGLPVAVLGHQKGRDIREKIRRKKFPIRAPTLGFFFAGGFFAERETCTARGAAGGGAVEEFSTRPWNISAGRTRTSRTSRMVSGLGGGGGGEGCAASKISGGIRTL